MKCAHNSTINNQINFYQKNYSLHSIVFLPWEIAFFEYLMKALGLSQEIKTSTKFCIVSRGFYGPSQKSPTRGWDRAMLMVALGDGCWVITCTKCASPSGTLPLPTFLPQVVPGWGLSSGFLLLILLHWGGLFISPDCWHFDSYWWMQLLDLLLQVSWASSPHFSSAVNSNNNKKAGTFINQHQLALFTPHF